MGVKRLLAGLVTGAAGVAAANRVLRTPHRDLDPPLDRPVSTYRWRGFDIAYTEAGDPTDPDLVVLHGPGTAASSYEFRPVIERLVDEYHVLAPDLPGYGHSDRPPLQYSGSLYVTFLQDFLRDLVGDEATVVASGLSATYATLAIEAADFAVARFVFVCPTTAATPGQRLWLRSLLRAPLVGEGLFNLLASRPALRYDLGEAGFSSPAAVPDDWLEYARTVAHQPGARFAPAAFLAGYLDVDVDLGDQLAALGVPTTIVWGREADTPSLDDGRSLAAAADARLIVFDNAGRLPHAEHPEEFLRVLQGDIATI